MPSNHPFSSNQAEVFDTIQRESTLASRVTRQIEGRIVEGYFQPGDRLPPERELARQFGVSRTVVREAVRALVAKSLLEVRAGRGTIVRSPSSGSVAQSITLFLRAGRPELDYDKVHEIRRVLEIEIAGLAAERRTARDLAEMESILQDAPDSWDDRDRYCQNDVDFHTALARATHNEFFSLLLDSVVDIMLAVRRMGFDVPDQKPRTLAHHHAILEQVKKGDAEGARQAMYDHLVEAENTMRRALAIHASKNLNEDNRRANDSPQS